MGKITFSHALYGQMEKGGWNFKKKITISKTSSKQLFFSGIGEDKLSNSENSEIDSQTSQPYLQQANAHASPPTAEALARSNLTISPNAELGAVAASNNKFEAFPPHRIFETANLLVSYGIATIEAFRATDEIARRYLFEDLRETEKLTFLQLA